MGVRLRIIISSNPVIILIIILIQTILMCVIIWIIIKTRWFSFILFLIFLGGLMVLFVYVVRLAANEKFELNLEEIKKLTMWIIIALLVTFLSSFFTKIFEFNSFNLYEQAIIIFSGEIMIIILLIIAYLLFTLIVAVKISSKYEGPLRRFI